MASPTQTRAKEPLPKSPRTSADAGQELGKPSATTLPFSHTPLEKGHFRLLRIVYAFRDYIVCEMRHFLVESPPQYFALSYVWGDEDTDCTILMQGAAPPVEMTVSYAVGHKRTDDMVVFQATSLSVTRNLFEGLRSIASFVRQTNFYYWIWIDAVCIDQSNLEEKATQIPLMGNIYQGADLVLIWFGQLFGPALTAYRVLEWFSHFDKVNYSFGGTTERQKDQSRQRMVHLEPVLAEAGIEGRNLEAAMEAMDIFHEPKHNTNLKEELDTFRASELGRHLLPADHEFWFHLVSFLYHPWFSRVWTIQEVRLAKGALLVGPDSYLPWNLLVHSRISLGIRSTGLLYSVATYFRVGPGKYAVYDINRASLNAKPDLGPDAVHEFHLLLLGIRAHNAKVRKDYVYGLLGMVEDALRAQITIDYSDSTPTEVVFSQAIRAACQLQNGAQMWPLLMEYYTDMSRELVKLPSWVPDFSSTTHTQLTAWIPRGHELSSTLSSRYANLARISFPEGSSVARVRGICVDRVECAATTSQDITVDLDTMAESRPGTSHVLKINEHSILRLFGPQMYSWFREMDSVFLQKKAGLKFLPVWTGEFMFERFTEHLPVYHDLRGLLDAFHDRDIYTVHDVQSLLGDWLQSDQMIKMVTGMMRIMTQTRMRYFFRTTSGRLGYAPTRVEPGDAICVIPGSSKYLHIISSDRTRHVSAIAGVEGLEGNNLLDALPLEESGWEDFDLH